MTESQYGCIHFDVRPCPCGTVKAVTRPNSGDVPLIFDNLAGAERYSAGKIEADARIGCQIYDRDGKIVGIFADTQVYGPISRTARRRNAVCWWAILCC